MLDTLDVANLVALHVLLEERHVTRAARRLGITQSSMSHRLARLRGVFDDPLLVSSARGLQLTPHAQSVAAPLAQALRAFDAIVAPQKSFDPGTTAYTLSIALPDALAPLAPRLIAAFAVDAPRFGLRLMPVVPALPEALAMGEPVLALAPLGLVSDRIMTRALGEVRFGVVGRQQHPAFRTKLTTKAWLAYGHVVVRLGNQQTNTIDVALARQGLRRRVGLEVPSFLSGLFALPSSDLLMNGPMQLLDEAAAQLHLTVREAPVRLPRVRISLCWHRRFHEDAAHKWARERVLNVVGPALRGQR